ncbi:hypothetical protein HNR28_003497 [Castellaniella defragrans]|uniref:Uncharacterized protein n=1 Tax=Castellaniella defragrans TaxID=75697 RepID=A0A7W9TTF1_CASDE|nr:hypothetical protein [Castellaniella defragrans]
MLSHILPPVQAKKTNLYKLSVSIKKQYTLSTKYSYVDLAR